MDMGSPESTICQEDLAILKELCTKLGVSIAPEKPNGPSPELIFLGIITDTLQGELTMPADKLQ